MDAIAHAAPVDFEFSLSRAAAPDAAHQPGHFRSRTRQPRQHIFQLRQLDLYLSFAAAGALREDVQDKLCPVDYLEVGRIPDGSCLARREVMIEYQDVGSELEAPDD